MAGPSEYVQEPLREGAEFTLYRGRESGGGSSALVLVPTAEYPSAQSVRQLEHEYSLAGELDEAWAARPVGLTRQQGRTVLILKDPGGEPLDVVLERKHGQPLDLTRFLRIAVNLAKALGEVHRRGLVHKDIKPGNVLVEASGEVWLTGFGIASQAPHKRQAPAPPEMIAGTLAYMAPEQTGRMNRSIDARSDLYSLGVTLYQMATGALPFGAADPLEWVHCHIARQPRPPGERAAVPEALSAITMKLLAKNAEERYQTAAGVEADLRRCLAQWDADGRIEGFALGAHDLPERLVIPEKLYGREREIEVLVGALERVVSDGRPELVLVSGYSGMGKSSVVNELHKVLVQPRGLFASGKFDQYKRDIPYATLAQAFQGLMRQILVKSKAEVECWRASLQEAVGANGQLMVNLIPELEFLIGRQAPIAELPARDARNRFQLVFRRFVGTFAKTEHPLALFLDDLQWLDTASLELFESLVTQGEVRYLLLVGAYRDNEVGAAHPLMRTLEAIRKGGARVEEIVLQPLGLEDVGALVAGALHCEVERGRSLAQLVHEKTGGNPFFAIQFLTALAEDGLVGFDSGARAWRWDVRRIRGKNYTDNVVDLMGGKLRRLSAAAQDALKHLACLGNVAESAMLAMVHGETDEALRGALAEAARAGLVIEQEGVCKFLHDRIQQAAYALIAEDDRAAMHVRIGRLLLARLTEEELGEHLFDVVGQFDRGAGLLMEPEEKAQVAGINLQAGRRAKASAAYAAARQYFASGIALLEKEDWSRQYELRFNLWLECAECELLSGHLSRAEQLIEELLPRGRSKVDQAAVYHLKVQLHVLKSELAQAVDSGLACLRLFGVNFPKGPTWEQVHGEYEALLEALDGRAIESLMDLPLMTDPELLVTMQALSDLQPPAYFTERNLACMVACRRVKIAVEHGTSGVSAEAYSYFGTTLGPMFHRYHDGYRFAKLACDLVDKHGFAASRGSVHFSMGRIAFWTQPLSTAIDLVRTVLHDAIEAGDLILAGHSMINCVTGLLLRNDPLDAAWRETERGLDFAERADFRDAAAIFVSQQRFIANMQGRTASFSTFNDAQFNEVTFENKLDKARIIPVIGAYWILKLKARFISGDYVEALAAADKLKPFFWAATGQIHQLDYYCYAALTVAAMYENACDEEQARWRDLLAAYREPLREWAEMYPPTFANKHLLVSAELARIEGRAVDAMQLYEEAIQLARQHGFVQDEGVAHEVAARFYAARGFGAIAHLYRRNARNCYDRWGALGKVRQLDEQYPQLREDRAAVSTASTISTWARELDVETIVKASQTLSSEIVLPKLIEKLMRIAVECAGAERGLLILLHGNEPLIEAEAKTGHGTVEVSVRETSVAQVELAQSALQYVFRTGQPVVVDDFSADNSYSDDGPVKQKRPRSVVCLPIVKQTKVIGALYLENNLTPRVFTSERVAVLELLASQAAISLENATLFSDLQRSEAYLAQGQSISRTGSFGRSILSGKIYWSEETYKIFEQDRSVEPTLESVIERIHPDDQDYVRQTIDRATQQRTDFDIEYRFLRADGSVKYVHVVARALESSSDELEYVGAVTDVTAAKQAEEKIRQSETELRQMLDLVPQIVGVFGPGGERLHANRTGLDFVGISLEEWRQTTGSFFQSWGFFHPDDRERAARAYSDSLRSGGSAYELESRLRKRDGSYRWFLVRFNPLCDEQGQITRWYVALTNIEGRKQAEERLQSENVALREEIDRASMFEEIVGASPALHAVLSRVSRVAPTDSTVLITGETGTGKELIARAVHKRSQRASRAFVSVNCAAIPRDLIASELFGHEKGAFTGAVQRRLGRFELAEGGTIFLDEIGELPAETQVALLRVLQEREFERVGGTGSIRTNVRVIAATNRDLQKAIAAGTFRSDLFYRFNVFPIEVPALRERGDDIPLLVAYFIDRYARKTGKRIRSIDHRSLELLQSYPWPGNIRELQNVVERSVIVCDTDNFSVDESWLSRQPARSEPKGQPGLSKDLAATETEIIEAALRESRGRVSGPSGAAAKLGIPGSTLESKIRLLKIDKNRFKPIHSSADQG